MGTVAVLGEALVDLLVRPGGAARVSPGGGPYNAARALARLGTDTTFLGRLSGDRFGRLLRSQLRADGVRLAALAPSPLPTTLALAEVDGAGAATYAFYSAGTSSADLTAAQALSVLPPAPSAVHVGSLGLVLEPHAAAVEAVLAGIHADVLVLCDPNCRRAAVADRPAYLARFERVLGRCDVVKVSGEDLDYLMPGRAYDLAAAELLAAGAAVVLVTDGAAPVRGFTARGRVDVEVLPVDVVDTVGAGDAFGAGFLHHWLAGGNGRGDLADQAAVGDAVRFAARVAALACTRPGAQAPTAADVAGFASARPVS
jgi:fructokinase